MWIFLGIVIVLLVLITVILLLPIDILLKTDENGELIFRYKLLGKTYGEDPDPNNPIAKFLKKAVGLPRLEKENLREQVAQTDLLTTVKDSVSYTKKLLGRVLELLRFGTVKTLRVTIVCASDDAAETAIRYGACYAAISPLLAFLHSTLRIKKSGERISITPDFTAESGSFDFEILARFRMFRALGALHRAAGDENERKEQETTASQKTRS